MPGVYKQVNIASAASVPSRHDRYIHITGTKSKDQGYEKTMLQIYLIFMRMRTDYKRSVWPYIHEISLTSLTYVESVLRETEQCPAPIGKAAVLS